MTLIDKPSFTLIILEKKIKKYALVLPRQNVTLGKLELGKKLPRQNVTRNQEHRGTSPRSRNVRFGWVTSDYQIGRNMTSPLRL